MLFYCVLLHISHFYIFHLKKIDISARKNYISATLTNLSCLKVDTTLVKSVQLFLLQVIVLKTETTVFIIGMSNSAGHYIESVMSGTSITELKTSVMLVSLNLKTPVTVSNFIGVTVNVLLRHFQ